MTTDWNAFCKERSNHIREQIEAEERRIAQVENNCAKLSEVSVQLGEIVKFHQEEIHEQAERLLKLEETPRKLSDSFKAAAISAGVSGLISCLITQLF